MIILLLVLTLALIVSIFINAALFWKQKSHSRQRRRKGNRGSICNDTVQKCCRLEFEEMTPHDEDTFHQLLFHNHGAI